MACGFTLQDEAPGPIRLYCRDCHRWAQFQRDGLIERFGADQALPDLLRKVQPCDRPNDDWSRCRLVYWDTMADSARAGALDRGDMPAAWAIRNPPPWWPSIQGHCEDLGRPAPGLEPHASFYDRKRYQR